jgi:hypothetical protein
MLAAMSGDGLWPARVGIANDKHLAVVSEVTRLGNRPST